MLKKSKGFTLAELLIVVAIIAVLVAISIPIFSSQLERARRAVDLSNARNIRSALTNAVNDGTISFNNKDATLVLFVGRTNTNGGIIGEKSRIDVMINGRTYNGTGGGQSLVWKIIEKNGVSQNVRLKQKNASIDWYGISLNGYGESLYYEGKGNMSKFPANATQHDWNNIGN